ncbi:MAG: hypothetical protein CMF72_22760 [Mameliella sp.]|nr:hypothetical protein [Mameliella sp.]
MSGGLDHPCLTCSLPDCDDTDSRCSLRRAMANYGRARRRKQITSEVRAMNSIAYQELYAAGRNERRKAKTQGSSSHGI